jgi:hypothetical protein
MTSLYRTEEILMVVKTYPNPSTDYGETVCTAGIRLRDGAWVRIYPYPFRLVDVDVRFKKWQVIEVPLIKATNDPRPESYKLYDVSKIRTIREISTEHATWAERMHFLEPTIFPSIQAVLDGIPPKGDQNWGATIRPVEIMPTSAKFVSRYIGDEWTAEEENKLRTAERLATGGMFSTLPAVQYKKLNKVPYEFRLQFEDLTGTAYDYIILDWEFAELFFKMKRRYGEDAVAVEKVRVKIEDEICSGGNRVCLVVGNMHHARKQKVLAVDGFVYPKIPKRQPAQMQNSLFGG